MQRILTPHPGRLEAAPLVRVDKGWGYELWLVNKDYCGKLLHFERGKKCSWHYHRVKDEVFYLHAGRLRVRYGYGDDLADAAEVVLWPGLAFAVPAGLRHQMEAEEESDLYEFSTHHDEADSIRLVKGD
jgi:mannose-6-phosphate isomerase-like protein (cupin superfamily)